MATRPDNIKTLNLAVVLALALFKNIPLWHYITTVELQERLIGAGIKRDLRSVQRQLELLCEHFNIECDRRSKPFAYAAPPKSLVESSSRAR